jgi:anti-sigma regulatory factor (Ser/Thr protein kinase)
VCRHATRPLPAEPHSAVAARAFLRHCFAEWELTALLDDAEVALTELVTNALRHARTPLEVSISSENAMVEIAVCDGSPVLPTLRPQRTNLDSDITQMLAAEQTLGAILPDDDPRLSVGEAGSLTGGRGLLLVQAIAAQWGASPLSDGKAVWIRTPVPEGWPHAVGCPCATSPKATPLASGHHVVHRD